MATNLTSSLWITGSLYVNGVEANAVSASYALTSSYSSNALTTASNALTKTGSSVELGGYMYRNTYITGSTGGSDPNFSFNKVNLCYFSDYSQFYTTRSLVDKGYVDNKLTGSLTITGSVNVSGSVSFQSLATLVPVDPLPSNPPVGSMASSGSGTENKLYYWNGSTWTAVF